MRMGSLPTNASTNSDVPWYRKAFDFAVSVINPGSVTTMVATQLEKKATADAAMRAQIERERVASIVRTEILNVQSQQPSKPEPSPLVPIAVGLAVALLLSGNRKRG